MPSSTASSSGRRSGKSRLDSLVEAGHKRARPIIMTTVAMVAGMVPVAISIEEFRVPMGVAVIGGLITSTALTLVIVPAMFTLVDDIERWVGPRLMRWFTTGEARETEDAVSGPRAG